MDQNQRMTRLMVDKILPKISADQDFKLELAALSAPGRSTEERAASRIRLSMIAGSIAGVEADIPLSDREQIGVFISRHLVDDRRWLSEIETSAPPPLPGDSRHQSAKQQPVATPPVDEQPGGFLVALQRWGWIPASVALALSTNPFLGQLQVRLADAAADWVVSPKDEDHRTSSALVPVRLTVVVDGLRIRVEPKKDATILGLLPFDTQLPIHAYKNGWYLVEYRPENERPIRGWVPHTEVHADYGPRVVETPSLGPGVKHFSEIARVDFDRLVVRADFNSVSFEQVLPPSIGVPIGKPVPAVTIPLADLKVYDPETKSLKDAGKKPLRS